MAVKSVISIILPLFSLLTTSCTIVVQQPSEKQNAATNSVTADSMQRSNSSSINDKNSSEKPPNIYEVVQVCKAVEERKDIPVGCKFSYLKDAPALVLSFIDKDSASKFLEPTVNFLAKPFCNASNSANRNSVVVIFAATENSAIVYSCEIGEASNWVKIGGDAI